MIVPVGSPDAVLVSASLSSPDTPFGAVFQLCHVFQHVSGAASLNKGHRTRAIRTNSANICCKLLLRCFNYVIRAKVTVLETVQDKMPMGSMFDTTYENAVYGFPFMYMPYSSPDAG